MKTITTAITPYIIKSTALLALALVTACTPQADDEMATAQPVLLIPTATIAQGTIETRATTTTDEVTISLTGGETLTLTMGTTPRDYTMAADGALTSSIPHIVTAAGTHTFSVDEAKVAASIAPPTITTDPGKVLPMNLKVAMAQQPIAVAANGTVTLPLAPTTAAMRLVLKTDAEVKPISVTCMPSGEVAPFGNKPTANTASRIIPLVEASIDILGTYAVAFGMLPPATAIKAGDLLAMIEITPGKTLALLAPATLTLATGQMVTYTVHVDHSVATITGVTIGGFTPGNGTGEDIGVGVAMADGTSTLDPTLFNEKNPVWNITGTNATILGNVKTALDALNSNTSARIDVILPNFAGTIGANAFNSCTALTSINLPAATSIGESAFSICTNLATINVPAATIIGKGAFTACELATISLPAATSIGYGAFYNCSKLTRLELTGTAPITMDGTTFLNAPTRNITLVLHSEATNATIGVTVEDDSDGNKKVTFLNGNVTFKAVEYIN